MKQDFEELLISFCEVSGLSYEKPYSSICCHYKINDKDLFVDYQDIAGTESWDVSTKQYLIDYQSFYEPEVALGWAMCELGYPEHMVDGYLAQAISDLALENNYVEVQDWPVHDESGKIVGYSR